MTAHLGASRARQPPLLRDVLRHVPTAVAVVCTADGRRPAGATVGSFVGVSLDPPLVAWFAMQPSSTLAAVRRSGAFAVNVLADDQGHLAEGFARPAADRFRGVPWRPGPGGSPHLAGALLVLDCDLHDVQRIGDHDMVVGRVTGSSARRPGARPLVFSGGELLGLASTGPQRPVEVARPA